MERSIARRSSSFKRSRRSSPPTSKFTSRFSSSSGTKQNKKIKFADFDDAPDRPSGHAKRTMLNHKTGGAKTSEFMYFKKLCGSAGQKAISEQQSVQAQESNKIRTSFSNQVEKETPICCIQSFSPHKEQLNEEPSCSELYDTPTYRLHKKESTYPALKITPLAQEPLLLSPEASRNSNVDCENERVFSTKRRNLIKLAAKSLSVGVDDFFHRRSDLIGELIQRLGIKEQPETKKSISSSHLETPMEKYTHLRHMFKLENLAHYASNLPTLPSIEAGLEANISLGWSIQELESSELYPDFGTGFHDKNAHDSTNCLLPSAPCHDLVPYSFGCEVPDQSLVPYPCFQSPLEKSNYELFWDVKENEEKPSHLPLALCNPAHFYDETEGSGGDMFFVSPPSEFNSSYVCEKGNYFSHTSDADFSLANEQSLVLVKENSANSVFEFGCDIPLLDPQYSLSASNWCAYQKDSSDPFLIDS